MRTVSTRRMVLALGATIAIAFTLLVGTCPGTAAPGIRPATPDGQVECQSKAAQVAAAASPGIRGTAVAYNSDPNHWDPAPLLSVKVHVGGRTDSCLVAHFSAMAQPQDNWVVFQVRLDGVPMEGHAAGLAGIIEPAVFDPDESTSIGPYRMVAHDFFGTVTPGDHLVEVLFAGCCSGNPVGSGAAVENPVITLEHQ
jgi:hypothetical protein